MFNIVQIKWDFNYAISGEARRSTAGAELDIKKSAEVRQEEEEEEGEEDRRTTCVLFQQC